MKNHSSLSVRNSLIAVGKLILFFSCDLLTGVVNPSSSTTTSTTTATTIATDTTMTTITTVTATTTTTTIAATSKTSYKPVISQSTAAEGKSAKVLTSSTFSFSEYNFALGCPALAGFTDSGTELNEGSTFQISYLGNTVTFTVNYFEDGAFDRIVKGIRYTGLSSDKSIELLIEYDPESKSFYYEQKLFIDDPTGMVFGTANAKSLVFYKMQGSVATDNSIIAYPQGIAFIIIPDNYSIFVCYKKMEYYSGAWDTSFTKHGVGVVFKDLNGALYADMPATSGSYSKPLESFTIADLPNASQYMKSELAMFTPSYLASYQLMYKVDGQTPFTSMATRKWQDDAALPTTNTTAKTRLPSATWKEISASSKY